MDVACLPPVLDRFRLALNLHDADALGACLHVDFINAQPAHPERNAHGRLMAMRRWAATFACVPDLRADLLRFSCSDGLVWTEWTFTGGLANGPIYRAGGVVIFAVCNDRIVWARTYTDAQPVEGPDWDRALAEALGTDADLPTGDNGEVRAEDEG